MRQNQQRVLVIFFQVIQSRIDGSCAYLAHRIHYYCLEQTNNHKAKLKRGSTTLSTAAVVLLFLAFILRDCVPSPPGSAGKYRRVPGSAGSILTRMGLCLFLLMVVIQLGGDPRNTFFMKNQVLSPECMYAIRQRKHRRSSTCMYCDIRLIVSCVS